MGNTLAGRTDNYVGNVRSAVENGLKHGAVGILNTDWGDNGHWQPLPVSYLGFAYGAALSWAYTPNADVDLPAVLDTLVFRDQAGVMGKLAYDLGNAYQQPGIYVHNGSFLFWIYQRSLDQMRQGDTHPGNVALYRDAARLRKNLHTTLDYIDEATARLDQAHMAVPDADLIHARMLELVGF